MLATNGRAERLLLMGSWGAGKTNAYMTIAKWLDQTGAPGQMYVIDCDYKAALDPNATLPNVHIYDELEHWVDYKETAKKCREQGVRGQGDWLVVDMADKVWNAAQAGYTEMTFGMEVDDFYIAWRKEDTKGGNPFNADWGKDWQAINRLYDGFMYNVTRFPGNVVITTGIEAIRDDEKDKDIIKLFGKWGVRPAGQKRLGHLAADTLLLSNTNSGYKYTCIRPTGREEFKNEPLTDFVMDYLVKRAGWTL